MKYLQIGVIVFLIISTMTFGYVNDSYATVYELNYEEEAKTLAYLGLFIGTQQGFELDREPTRVEALVILLRLMGVDTLAKGYTGTHDFEDVPSWADPYVAYAYNHGIAKGVSRSIFGSQEMATEAMYLTFILRALGYDDTSGDFLWQKSHEKAYLIGLIESREPGQIFLRDHCVDIAFRALSIPMKEDSRVLLTILVETGAVVLENNTWYGAPSGKPDAAGTIKDPLNIETLILKNGPVKPGDNIVLMEGTYFGRFVSHVSGTKGLPIIITPFPDARVILDSNVSGSGAGITIEGDWVEVHQIEVTNSHEDRSNIVSGVVIFGSNVKLINCIIHNTAQGIGFWSPAVNSEVYGNIIYNNGFQGPTRGHGHGIYTQNKEGIKRIEHNIIFFGYGFGIQAYTEKGNLNGFDILNNVWFRTGASIQGESKLGHSDGCLVGGLQPVSNTRLIGNHSWSPSIDARNVRLGWSGSVYNEDITLMDNYFVGHVGASGFWQQGTFEQNTFHSSFSGIDPLTYPNNIYDSHLPTGTKVVVQPNKYDDSRVDLIIYNWNEHDAVALDLSAIIPNDFEYEIYSVFDLWGLPVIKGRYQGDIIQLPMGTKPPVQPNGFPDAITGTDDPGKTFGVYILRILEH